MVSALLMFAVVAAEARPVAACAPGELRVSAARDAWFDVYVDGAQVMASRVRDGQQAVELSAGRRHVRVTDFMGRTWSVDAVDVGCGEVLVGEVVDGRGLVGLSRFAAAADRPGAPLCRAGSLSVVGRGDVWFDLYVDGVPVLERRSFDGPSLVRGLEPGRHHVRVTSFMGEVWSEGTVDVRCGEPLELVVREGRGLR